MHDAYIISPCIKTEDQIESIEGCGQNEVIIGTRTGRLYFCFTINKDLIYKPNICSNYQTIDNKPICQMKTVPKEDLLFVLSSNGVINVFYIGRSHFSLIHRCDETKGCNIFAIDVKITQSQQSDETDTLITLCVSKKQVLSFFVWKSERLQLLDKQIKLKDEPKALSFVNNMICIGFKDEYVAYNLATKIPEEHELIVTSSSRRNSPCICVVKNSTFGIIKDEFLILIDSNTCTKQNKVLDKYKPIKWGSSVLDLVWDEPYVIGQTVNGVEIHMLENFELTKYTLVQAIPDLKNAKFLSRSHGNGVIFAASQTEVWYIKMVDVSLQMDILLTQKKFKLAIELTNLSNESQLAKSKVETVREIRILYARDLFMKKNFEAAFREFLEADANPLDVILLFPTSIKGEFKNFESSSHPNMPVLKDKDLEDATLALTNYLIVARQKVIYLKSELLPIMDTTLLKCYLQTNDALVAPLIRRKKCHFLESEKVLKEHGKLNELIILYHVFEEHAKALTLLKAQASVEGSSLFGHERTVKYLLDLDKNHKDLIFEFSQWVLAKHPEDGLTIFTNTYCEQENNLIPKNEVLDFLSKTNQSLVLPYLEHIVNDLEDPSPIIHEELITAYVNQIKKLNEKRNLSEVELKELQSYRSKLIEILKKSDKYCPERILQMFPSENFFNERVQVLERMNDHKKILVIYIQVLGNVEKALEYCEKVKDSDVFEILFHILLHPLKASPYEGVQLHSDFLVPNLDIIIQILNKYPTKMNPAKVLSLLPGDIPVYRIKNYMEIVSQMNMNRQSHYVILKEILNAEILRLIQEIILHRKKHCTILSESCNVCKECEKHFCNGQVFVRNADGDVLHLACLKKKHQISCSE